MIDQLQVLAELVARASWQAALLAAIVAVVVWCFGERLAARWRYLLWSIVLVRMLLIVAPVSSWSLYQFARWDSGQAAAHIARLQPTAADEPADVEIPLVKDAAPYPPAADDDLAGGNPSSAVEKTITAPSPAIDEPQRAPAIASATETPATATLTLGQWLAIVWFLGMLVFGGRLLWAYFALRRKLARCEPVQDEAILRALASTQQKLGIRRHVGLLVTAEPISPCVVGAWRPQLVMPELALTELDERSLRQVFCHELAHVVRGDLWTNWLMLCARCLHWFNPVAWWMVREMQSLREMACDERTLTALDADQRQDYADTILSLVGLLAPSPLAPGMVALFSSRARLARRIEHIALGSFGSRLSRIAACLVLVILALAGWTDAGRIAAQQPPADKPATPSPEPPAPATTEVPPANAESDSGRFDLRGRTMKWIKPADGKRAWEATPLGEVDIELYRILGPMGQPEKIAESKSDVDGYYSFKNLTPSLWEDRLDRVAYGLVLRAPGLPPSVSSYYDSDANWPYGVREEIAGIPVEVSGQVVNEQGIPVAGATVYRYGIHGEPVPGVQSAITDDDGRFAIRDLSISEPNSQKNEVYLIVRHPDYPKLHITVPAKEGVTLTLPTGCLLTGTVVDEATGKPVPAGMFVVAQEDDNVPSDAVTITDDEGRYRLVVAEGSYNILAESAERVTAQAITHQEAIAGKTVELPPITTTPGGWIEGRVINTKTGQPVVDSRDAYSADQQQPYMPRTLYSRVAIGLFGPGYPPRKRVISQEPLVRVDDQGRFRLRASAGDNFPYLANAHGQRMAWDTRKQPPVVVKTGETTHYDMLITPKPTDAEKTKAAGEAVTALPKEMPARVEAILAEFRKLNHTVDETEIWCSLIRELVAIGHAAVPALSDELDATDEQRTMRRLAFALRAIGDPRAVPALIRAIPKTLQPPLSDYGLLVGDPELLKFMQQHDLASMSGKRRLRDFDFGRPVREVFGALEKLTRQNLGDDLLYSVVKTDDPGAEAIQQRMYRQQAEKWQAWWEQNWRDFTADEAYGRVGLPPEEQPAPRPFAVLAGKARTGSGKGGFVLSPLAERGDHFLDLDTGLEPKASEGKHDQTHWAAQNGVDLMCVDYQIEGQSVYALRAFNMRVQEISLRDAKNIDKFLERGELPAGKPVGEILLRLDDKTGRYAAGNAAFLYQTREGGLGVIELTDQITEARDITGQLFTSKGVGFHKGAKFNYHPIVPAR
jgi:beta-lactamase regulating signal transducer with metallopeptidase domain